VIGHREEGAVDSALDIVVSGTSSDSHTWNLLYLQLFLEDRGHRVVNLGACVPDDLLTDECCRRRPALVVLSSVNGHGSTDGGRVVRQLRRRSELATTAVVIGGKLSTGQHRDSTAAVRDLLAAGFDAVFDRPDTMAPFVAFLESLPMAVSTAC
jgi:methylaspartate mutase sigma subunit